MFMASNWGSGRRSPLDSDSTCYKMEQQSLLSYLFIWETKSTLTKNIIKGFHYEGMYSCKANHSKQNKTTNSMNGHSNDEVKNERKKQREGPPDSLLSDAVHNQHLQDRENQFDWEG